MKSISERDDYFKSIIDQYDSGPKGYISEILKKNFIKITCDDCGIIFYRSLQDNPKPYCSDCYYYRKLYYNNKKMKSALIEYKAIIKQYNNLIKYFSDDTIYTPLNI